MGLRVDEARANHQNQGFLCGEQFDHRGRFHLAAGGGSVRSLATGEGSYRKKGDKKGYSGFHRGPHSSMLEALKQAQSKPAELYKTSYERVCTSNQCGLPLPGVANRLIAANSFTCWGLR